MRTAIASIAYTRGLFPEKCFEKATLRGAGSSQDDRVTVRLLRPHRVDDGAAVLYQWIEVRRAGPQNAPAARAS